MRNDSLVLYFLKCMSDFRIVIKNVSHCHRIMRRTLSPTNLNMRLLKVILCYAQKSVNIYVVLSIYNPVSLPLTLLYQPPTSSKTSDYLIFPHLWDFHKIIALCWCHRSCQMAHGLQTCSPFVSTIIRHF